MELRKTLPPSQLKILALRRFANPVTGEWITTTREVADFIGTDRSTAQKSLQALERQRFLHMRYLRGRTVDLLLFFGGFPEPAYRDDGLLPLEFDETGDP